ncbi:serine hydrolase [Algoriphagus zhangzhouensis]|uniref:beta-lactamase n=1 Tax=Algoriphagus zhangzhouensis TaxID=1073327 RepID=A0A1M7ZHC4_9BACT|nr:serine hydrolase [Algoriphagus zhangzhouensis]TDY44153.1 beta-lactamase class A [Algoriphagus zhangzhouensis]SHO64301.1 beta-lactamase class A [Algoriphagus zhangzhouensis]
MKNNPSFLLITLLIVSFFYSSIPSYSQSQKGLEKEIQSLVEGFHGDVGIYIQELGNDRKIEINADTVFSTASIVKIPIMLGIFDKIEKDELSFHQALMYRDSIKYGGSGLMQFFQDSTQTDLRTLIALMLSYSDNTTSLWNQALAGGGTQINELMEKLGYTNTRVNSRTPGREKIWEKYGWGQTSPKEMADILVRIYQKELITPAASEQMYRLLSNTYYNDYALSQIPPGVNVASKQGMVNASRSEVFLVNGPESDFVVAIFTDHNEDTSWKFDNEAWELTRKITLLVWNYFNPKHPYSPPVGIQTYLEGLPYE